MKLNLKHTMLVRATGRGEDEPRWYKAIATSDFDVTEGDAARFPMAFSFRREAERSPTLYRMDRHSGQLYLRVGTLTGFDRDDDMLEWDDRYPTNKLFKRVQEDAQRLSAEGHSVDERSRRGFYPRCSDLCDQMHVNKQDMELGYKAFRECMQGWMFMDRYMWQAVPEPMFHVYRTNVGWKTAIVPQPHGYSGRDRRHFHFGLGQYEELLSWKARLSELTARHSTEDEFEAFNVYEATRDGFRTDLEFALDDVLERFSLAAKRAEIQHLNTMNFSNMPYPLFEMFARARKLRHEAEVNWSDELAGDIVAYIEDVAEFVTAHPMYAELFAKPKENELQIEKWHSRPVSVLPTLGFISKP